MIVLTIAIMCISAGILGASIVLMVFHSREMRQRRANGFSWKHGRGDSERWYVRLLSRYERSASEDPPTGELIVLDDYRKSDRQISNQ